MAKISALPEVLDPDGHETVVVLKDGVAKRASIRGILAPSINALEDRVFAPKFIDLALSRSLVEYGDTGAINLAWSVSDAPASQQLNGGAIAAGDRSAVLQPPPGGWVADTPATLALFNGSGKQTDARTLLVAPRIPLFVGIASSATPTNAALIAAAYKALDSDHMARGLTLARAGGGYPFVLFPSSLALSTIKLGGFAVVGWASVDRAVTLATGAVVAMKLVILDAVAASASPLAVDLA